MSKTVTSDYKKMIEMSVGTLIFRLSIPTIISMLITNIYNLVDAYFVGRLGTSASGAIGIMLGIQGIMQAFGFMFGHGAGSIISRKLGEKNPRSASLYASVGFFFSFAVGATIAVIGSTFLEPLLRVLGCTDSILPYAKPYAFYILLSSPFFTSSCTMNNILRYEGKAALAMVGLSCGGILNMIGDPFFMFSCHLNMSGAGISTALSQVISFCLLLYMFLSGRSESKLSLSNCKGCLKELIKVAKNGSPSLIRQGLNCISTMVLNICAGRYGDYVIAGMSIVNRVMMFIVSIVIGIGQALQPVAAYNYGAGKWKRVKEAVICTVKMAEGFLVVIVFLGFAFSSEIIMIFQKDPSVVKVGATALRFQCLSLICQPIGVYANMIFQSTGKSLIASILSSLRSGIYFIPLILILPQLFGLIGIQMAQMIADLLTAITAVPFLLSFMRELSLHENSSLSP